MNIGFTQVDILFLFMSVFLSNEPIIVKISMLSHKYLCGNFKNMNSGTLYTQYCVFISKMPNTCID